MSPKTPKKTIWLDCERCGHTVLANDKVVHNEGNCEQDGAKCPFVMDRRLHTRLEKIGYPPEGAPKDSVILHPSAATLLGATIGGAIEISRKDSHSLVRRMWPSKTVSPAAVVVSVVDLPDPWIEAGSKEITASVVTGAPVKATQVTIKVLNHKTTEEMCDILKHHFYHYIVASGTVLVYYYFGKKLEIEITSVKTNQIGEDFSTDWFMLNESTIWNFKNDNVSKPKKNFSLGGVNDILDEIRTYIEISFNSDGFNTSFQPTRGLLLYGHSGVGKTTICKHLINTLQCHHVEINGPSVFSRYFGETESTMKSIFEKAVQNEPSIILVDEIETICPKRSSSSSEQERRITSAFVALLDKLHEESNKVFILATTQKPEHIDSTLRRFGRLDKEIEIPAPDRIRRKEILCSLLENLPNKISMTDVENLANLAHGYVAADLVNLCTQASMKCIKRSCSHIEETDLYGAFALVRPSAMRELLIEVPNVKWSDIGGQDNLKLKLRQAVEWPLIHPDSFQRLGVRPPCGVLLYGPPGCSKTMVAKALATESGLNFLSIKGPEIFSKWVGESERTVRELFHKARQVAPSIIFFDEVDAIGGMRGSGEANVHERVLAQLLTELDGVVPLNKVTIVAATNRPDRIDRALLRPGRLDRLIYVPLPDCETRLHILELKLGKMMVGLDVNPRDLANRTIGFSGAELHALCHEAAMRALEKDINCDEVTMQDFEYVLEDFKPRTPKDLLDIYERFALGQRST